MRKLLFFSIFALTSLFVVAQVTYTVTVPTGTNECHIAGSMTGWSLRKMTLTGTNTYSITISGATTSDTYKYCSGPYWNFVERQANCTDEVPDRTYSANDVVECWTAVYDPTATPPVITIRVKVPDSWTNPKIHYWGMINTTWPGVNLVQDGEWWTHTFDQVYSINFNFNNQGIVLTQNILDVRESTCYRVYDDNSYQVISCVPEPPGKTYNVTVPTGTNKCYIAGAMTGWSPLEMTQVTPTTYTVFISTATSEDRYKYLSGPGWAWEELQADCSSAIVDRYYAENDVVACWKAVYDPAVVPQDYVYNVTVPSGTYKCYIAGNATNWSHTEMTKLTGTTYTITFNTTTPNGYKFCSGPSWSYEELNADGSGVSSRDYNQENTVALWREVFNPTLTDLATPSSPVEIKGLQSCIQIETGEPANVSLYSIQGSLLKKLRVNHSTHISNLNSGVYLLRINGKTYKAIVQ